MSCAHYHATTQSINLIGGVGRGRRGRRGRGRGRRVGHGDRGRERVVLDISYRELFLVAAAAMLGIIFCSTTALLHQVTIIVIINISWRLVECVACMIGVVVVSVCIAKCI